MYESCILSQTPWLFLGIFSDNFHEKNLIQMMDQVLYYHDNSEDSISLPP